MDPYWIFQTCYNHRWIPFAAFFAALLSGCAGSSTNPGQSATKDPAPRSLVSIAVTPASSSIAKGTVVRLSAAGMYSDGSTQDLTDSATWSSSNPSIATVTSTGMATGDGVGTDTIRAASGSLFGSAALTVTTPALSSISVAPANPIVAKGATQQLTATGLFTDGSTQNLTSTVTWISSNAAIATVSAAGIVTAESVGACMIKASSGSVAISVSLTVTSAALSSISLSPSNPSIPKGTTQQFTATGTFADGSTQNLTNLVTWSSSNTSVAIVNSTGLANGLTVGEAAIQALSGSISSSAALTVTPPALSSIAVLPANPSIANGASLQFKAIGTYGDGSTQDLTNSVTWASSNTSVSTINGSGLATAGEAGTSNIQAALGGINGSTTLTVTSAVTVSLSPASATLPVATGTQQFIATVNNDPQNGGVTWSLSGAGCSGIACGTLSSTSSASGAPITYTAPAAVPSPSTLTLTATSVSDPTRSGSALITINTGSTPAGSTFTESFGDSSTLCWSGGPSSCDQTWVAQGSAQAIVATPGAPPPNTAGSNSLQMIEPAGSAAYLYTTGTFPRLPSGAQFDLYFTLNVASQAMNAFDVTRLLIPANEPNGSDFPAQISFTYDGANLQLQAGGASDSAKVNISLNSWHTVQLHIAAGGNASFLSVDGAAPNAFTENPTDFAYLVLGSAAGNFDAISYYIGNVYINSSLGGGPPPSMYIDFENSTDGTTLTTDILAASTHCGNGIWSLSTAPLTGMTISGAGQQSLPNPVTTCGVQYTGSGTRGLQYDMSQTARRATYTWSTTSSSASVGFFFQITVSDSNFYTVFNIDGGGVDYAALNVHAGTMFLETKSGGSNPVPISPNVWYWITIQYNAGGTHRMQVYDGQTFTLLGDLSGAATGNFPPNDIEIGRNGSESGFPSAFWYYDNIVADYITAKFPILPGSY